MGTGFLTPSSSWTELTSPDYVNRLLTILVDGTGDVELILEVALPASGATGMPLPAGTHLIIVPEGKQPYIRVNSGSADIYYPAFSGITCEVANCGYTFSGGGGSNTGASLNSDIEVGFDNVTTRAASNPYELRGYLITNAAGVASGDTLQAAILGLRILKMYQGRTIRVYGLKYNSSQASSVTGWSALNGLTKTTAYVDFSQPPMGLIQVDIKTIVDELKAVSGWTTSSPIQLILIDQGSAVASVDSRMIISRESLQTNVTILIGSGGGGPPSPP